MSNEMVRNVLIVMVSIEARLRTKKTRLKILVTIPKVLPLNQPASKTVYITYDGMLMTALKRSTRARLAMKIFGTVRKDLNRAMTARTQPLPRTEAEVRILTSSWQPWLKVVLLDAFCVLRSYERESQFGSFDA